MTKKLNKRGFTIVELVVVIVVIAILAAVLIPTISSLVSKANKNKDTQLVRNLNTALAADVNKHNTMSEALAAAAEFGYDVAKINASEKDNEILWDSVNDVFCYLDEGNVTYIPNSKEKDVKDYQLWKIYTEAPETQNQKYSIYWNSESNFDKTLTVGFDAGKYATNLNLSYEHTSGDAQDVTIRTNGGTLTINALQDTVRHYGNAATVNVTEIAGESYHAHGTVGVITVKKGHVVVENGATVSTITKSSSATESDTVSITNNGTITAAVGVDVDGTKPQQEVTTTKGELNAEGGYYRLENDQTISTTLTIDKDTVLDLNGKTITFDKTALIINADVTIIDTSEKETGKLFKQPTKATDEKNKDDFEFFITVNKDHTLVFNSGSIVCEKQQKYDNTSIIYVYGKLVVNGGTMRSTVCENTTEDFNANGVIGVQGQGAQCYINGGDIECTKNNPAIQGNGSKEKWGTYIEINGGNLKGGIAIYHPQVGTLNINGGYIKGETAVYQKAGTMNITGGTFEATANEQKPYSYNNNGADVTGDAIVIDSCKGYDTPYANITLSDTKIIVMDSKCKKVAGYVQTSYKEGDKEISLNNALFIVWNGEEVRAIEVK